MQDLLLESGTFLIREMQYVAERLVDRPVLGVREILTLGVSQGTLESPELTLGLLGRTPQPAQGLPCPGFRAVHGKILAVLAPTGNVPRLSA